MAVRRTNRGQVIDLDSVMSSISKSTPAVGNMRVNADGDVLGANGEIVQKSEDRVRAYYKNNPKSSAGKTSLKGNDQSLAPDEEKDLDDVTSTSKTLKENSRTAKPQEPPVAEPEEFDAPGGVEPLGYKEVELPNGDIEMVPYYREEDK